MSERCGNTIHASAGYIETGDGHRCQRGRDHEGSCLFGAPSILLDDPALRELVDATTRLRDRNKKGSYLNYDAILRAEEDMIRSLTALTTAYPSLASPEKGAG